MSNILSVKNLTVKYRTRYGTVHALSDVSFDIKKGSIVGIIGESGSGKSTLGHTILRTLPENAEIKSGEIIFNEENILAIDEEKFRRDFRWKRISMIFQNSMNAFSPVHRIQDQLLDVARKCFPNKTREDLLDIIKEKLKIANIDESVLKKYPHELSGGQRQRVAIGMALLADPEVVIADEPTTGLDVVTQYQILNRLKQIQEDLGITLLLITHDVSVVAALSTDVLVLYAGKVLEYGKTKRVFKHSNHPYTYLLLKSYPDIGKEKLYEIPGSPPDLRNPPSGCVFHPRCPYATDICREEDPKIREVEEGHLSACHYAESFVKEVETQ
ncbi:ABC transporter ATP-binding protein [Thermococcus sp. M39]|uniref:ABC transporter ATP-binding protein n=1 Tax=unclassified Thermococcus TaxID=2627626 RepID=UPI00143AB568|nr:MULTISPECIES: ABC transporter ATP-binding protein [unclassified Thermococcus]NJE08133.1 ABC transporter ATP-binding protein [Thermococcus sp. M39]NJE11626.1 ABC transporter ATP-binding protein [Thermococcus sp. LS2]